MDDPRLGGLEKNLMLGNIDRRQFVVGAVGMGASLSLALSTAENAAAATPRKGGNFRVGVAVAHTSDSLEPATFGSKMMTAMSYSIWNHLTEIAPSGELIPELAESFESSKDAKTWTFRLRKDVKFHDGKQLTAEDVIVSYQSHLGEDSKSGSKSSVEQIESFEKDGDHVVIFRLKNGNADFPYVCTDYRLPIMPTKDGKLDWQSGIGTGGYILESFEPGVRTSVTRNPNYWKEGRAHFDSCEFIAIADPTARQNAVKTGAIDAAPEIPAETAHLMAKETGLRLVEVTGSYHHTWPMITTMAPFDNNDFRLAIKHAVNREEVLQKVLNGRGALANDHPISTAYPYFADLPQREQDLEKAKYHLKKSGNENAKLELYASDGLFNGAVNSAVLFKEHLAGIGVDVNVNRVPSDGYFSQIWLKKPWVASYWNGRPTPDWMLTTAYADGVPYNETLWSNERFNKLLIEARVELNQVKRTEMYREMQLLIRNQGGTLIPTFANFIMALRDNVKHGPEVANNWPMDGGKATERWWFE